MSRTTADFCGAVTVGTSSTPIIGANGSRKTLVLSNDSPNVVYLQFTTSFGTAPTAALNSGARLGVGGSLSLENFRGAVAGISGTAGSVVTVLAI